MERDLKESIDAGIQQAVVKSHRCPHGNVCPFWELSIQLPGEGAELVALLRSCALDWFDAEYPTLPGMVVNRKRA